MTIAFHVRGEPRTHGSTRAFIRGGRPMITSDTKGYRCPRERLALLQSIVARADVCERGFRVGRL